MIDEYSYRDMMRLCGKHDKIYNKSLLDVLRENGYEGTDEQVIAQRFSEIACVRCAAQELYPQDAWCDTCINGCNQHH
jgi:hypothetical protein